MRFRLVVDGEGRDIEVERSSKGMRIRVDGAEYRSVLRQGTESILVRIGPRTHRIRFDGQHVFVDGASHRLAVAEIVDERSERSRGGPRPSREVIEVRTPMPGRVIRLAVTPGLRVKRGQTLAVLEAMKMQNEISAPMDGIVREVRVAEGESISGDRVVAVLEIR